MMAFAVPNVVLLNIVPGRGLARDAAEARSA